MKPRLCSRHTWQLLHHIDWLIVSLYLRYNSNHYCKTDVACDNLYCRGWRGEGVKKSVFCGAASSLFTPPLKKKKLLILSWSFTLFSLFCSEEYTSAHTHTALSVSSCLLLTWCCVNIWVHVHVNLGLQSFPALALWTLSLTFCVPWVRWDQTFMSVKVCLDWSQLPLFIVCLLIVRVSRQGQVRGN